MKTPFAEKGVNHGGFSKTGRQQLDSFAGSKTILLISRDSRFHERLRSLANALGLFLVKSEHASGTVAILQATRPVALLLDLDLPHQAAWQIGDAVLNEPGCPAVILLSGRADRFDMRTAIRAGSLVTKNESPDRLLKMVEERLELPEASQAEQNEIQRVLIRWLRPSGWAESKVPARRFWGTND